MHQVFVYGTLRPGGRNHHFMATATHLGAYTTPAAFTLLDTGPYPAALDEGKTALVGDVFTVDDDTFAALDRLEDYPVHYTRRKLATDYGDAWVYLWIAAQDPTWPVIDHGDWCRHMREHSDNS
ncbi:Putative gamma-glutamylcyclotransferase protein [Salinisphaera shabanensis E1L3A]|uniref:Gamma-glutamylcyclotransferase family protein n=2 Tax=Salinisphaera shabanensis TaxID=180542 RepID=U2EHA2_9GAMM|nr:Putative gamma-glutamylcyclotransferase protein [Salinisphaera shabanensis E1L3A]